MVGFDIDPQVVQHWASSYSRHNLNFVIGDIVDPKQSPLIEFDAVIRFEVIEQVGQQDGRKMVANCAAHLREASLFILSTPGPIGLAAGSSCL